MVLCEGNPLVNDGFPIHKASNVYHGLAVLQITIIYGIAMLTTALGCLAMTLARPHSFYEFLAASIIFGVSIGRYRALTH